MSDALDLYYWDACIFYEFCKDEPVDPMRKQAIDDLLFENKGKRNRICTSVITHSEVIPKKVGSEGERKYWEKFGSLYFYDIDVDRSIILLSRELKDYYYAEPSEDRGYRMLSTGDSIQLATAIIHSAKEFHTRDGNRKGGNVPLIGLPESSPNGKLCGQYPLTITSPVAAQGRFEGH